MYELTTYEVNAVIKTRGTVMSEIYVMIGIIGIIVQSSGIYYNDKNTNLRKQCQNRYSLLGSRENKNSEKLEKT